MQNWKKRACRFFIVVAVSFLAAQLLIWFGSNDIDEFIEQENNDRVKDEGLHDKEVEDKADLPNRSDLFRQLDSFQHPDGEGMK